MGKSVRPVYGLLSVSHGLAEGDSKVAGLCPSVFACAPLVCCVSVCIHASHVKLRLLLAQNVQ